MHVNSSDVEQFNPNFDAPVFIEPVLTVEEVAKLLRMEPSWVYTQGPTLRGYRKFGRHVRFIKGDVARLLMSVAGTYEPVDFDAVVFIDPVLIASEVANLLRVDTSWVYAHAREIPGYRKFGRYVRFIKGEIVRFLGSSSHAERVC